MPAIVNENRAHWFALRVKPRHEVAVAKALRSKGYEEFLPLRTDRRRWSDRFKEVSSPLFPGYVFCHFSPASRVGILETPAVRKILSFGNGPTPIDEREVHALQTIAESGFSVAPHPYLRIGQTVRLTDGPLRGLEGILQCCRGVTYLIVSVTLMQRSVAVQVSRDSVCADIRAGREPLSEQVA